MRSPLPLGAVAAGLTLVACGSATPTTGTGGVQTLNVSGTGRFIRMYGTARATPYGYSLWEFGVY